MAPPGTPPRTSLRRCGDSVGRTKMDSTRRQRAKLDLPCPIQGARARVADDTAHHRDLLGSTQWSMFARAVGAIFFLALISGAHASTAPPSSAQDDHTRQRLSDQDLYASKGLRTEVRSALSIYGVGFITEEELARVSISRKSLDDLDDELQLGLMRYSVRIFELAALSVEASSFAFISSSLRRPRDRTSRDETGEMSAYDPGDADSRAVELLTKSALLGHREGVALLARALLFGVYKPEAAQSQDKVEVSRALERSKALTLLDAAAALGSPGAHSFLGLLFSAGLLTNEHPPAGMEKAQRNAWDGLPKKDPYGVSRSLLHLYLGANGGDAWAHLALGYKHAYGIGVPKSCQTAVLYYDPVAYRVADQAREPASKFRHASGAPNKYKITSSEAARAVRWQQQHNTNMFTQVFNFPGIHNVYDRINSNIHSPSRTRQETDLVQYYEFKANAGHSPAQTAMGEIFLSGSSGMPQDFGKAFAYFDLAAGMGNEKEAMAHLGHMYANGLGVEQSNATSMKYFQVAADMGSAHGMYGLGYMHLSGYIEEFDEKAKAKSNDEEFNVKLAIKYLHKAADKGHVEAIFLLGVVYLNGWDTDISNMFGIIGQLRNAIIKNQQVVIQKSYDTKKAYKYFQIAAYAGHPIAMYNTAMLRLMGVGTSSSCQGALEILKPLAERLSPETELLEYAYREVFHRVDTAAITYLLAAYSGMEVAQTNVAYLMQHGTDVKFDQASNLGDGRGLLPHVNKEDQALSCHKQAAEQGNMASLLAIGDMFYYGYGVTCDMGKAGEAYRQAAETAASKKPHGQLNNLVGGVARETVESMASSTESTPFVAASHAYFNLGVLHQLGIGLSKDLHLAKRFFDLAKDTHPIASGPCAAAIILLRVQHHFDDFDFGFIQTAIENVLNFILGEEAFDDLGLGLVVSLVFGVCIIWLFRVWFDQR